MNRKIMMCSSDSNAQSFATVLTIYVTDKIRTCKWNFFVS